MPTYAIANTNRDGSSQNTGEFVLPSQAPFGTFYVGYDGGASFDWAGIWDTAGANLIPQGATILTASVALTRLSTDYQAGFTGDWWGFAVDTPSDFSATHTHRISDHHTRTSASVADNSWTNAATHTSPSLVSIIQEIVNRAGFAGVLGLTYRVNSTTGGWFNVADYSDSSASAATLTVTWDTGGGATGQMTLNKGFW